MKVWNWIKTLPVWALLGALGTAIVMVMASQKATRLERRAENAERAAENLAHDRTKKGIEEAAKHQRASEAAKEKAKHAKAVAEAKIEELGGKDETLDDIADRFNSRRLRKSADRTS